MSSERRPVGKGHKPPLHRTLFIDLVGIDLDTPEGQNELIKKCQILLATTDHNTLDLAAFKILKESVKVKTDLNVWMQFTQMKKAFDEWRESQGKKV
jgi:hypothetical protein